ncbi:hypothetical protein ABE28_002605 [Peribacillus muralis]|uniref:Uncharacterized protein n=1 Tax=Peribacillus muralis TaxID=264697 RepID=A0A1B3XJ61_9BACI|nr:hypothetical protein ABE28_002605 [Peribacillus muralis]
MIIFRLHSHMNWNEAEGARILRKSGLKAAHRPPLESQVSAVQRHGQSTSSKTAGNLNPFFRAMEIKRINPNHARSYTVPKKHTISFNIGINFSQQREKKQIN